jgi:hypothetical protein
MVAGLLRFFERRIFFSLDPHRSDSSQREEDGRPGAYDHSNDLPMDLIPELGFRLVRQSAMDAGRSNVPLIITEQVRHPLSPLCFTHEDQDRLPAIEYQSNGLL